MLNSVLCLRRTVRIGLRFASDNSFEAVRARKAAEGRKKLAYIGAPLILFLIGGSVLLSQFLDTHMELKDKQNNSKTTRNFDLEEEHRALMKKLDLDNFSLSRIPRPAGDEEVSKVRDSKTDSSVQKKATKS